MMMKSLLVSVAILCTSVSFADAGVRRWTDITGQHTIEAEAVAVKQGWVQLKRADGKLVSVEITKLSKADQQHIADLPLDADGRVQQDDEPADPGTAVSDLKMSAKAQWSEARRMGIDNNELPRDLQVAINLSGEPASEATAIGFVEIDSAIDDNGSKLIPKKGFDSRAQAKELVKIVGNPVGVRNKMFTRLPDKGILLVIDFKHPSAPTTEIASIKGSLKLNIGATSAVVELDVASLKADKPILDDAFQAAGLKVKVGEVTAKTLSLVGVGNPDAITDIEVIDSAGEELPTTSVGGAIVGDTYTRGFEFVDETPAGTRLLISVVSGGTVVDVPFEFNELEVPPAP